MAVNPLMTETLPTLVGVGVVSRAAEMALTRRGRRTATGYRAKHKRPKIYRGPRGGRYILKRGRKVYI